MSTKLLPRRVARSGARFGTTIAAAVALLISAAPSGAQAATPLPEVIKAKPPELPGLGNAAPAPA